MSSNGDSTAPSSAKEDILKSLLPLNSCITLTSFKDKETASESSSSDSESESSSFPRLPGISIQSCNSNNNSVLKDILEKEKKDKEAKNSDDNSTWLNDWSKRCLSISLSSKPSRSHSDSEEEKSEENEPSSDNSKSESDSDGHFLKNGNEGSSSSDTSRLSSKSNYKSLQNSLPFSKSITFAATTKPSPQNLQSLESDNKDLNLSRKESSEFGESKQRQNKNSNPLNGQIDPEHSINKLEIKGANFKISEASKLSGKKPEIKEANAVISEAVKPSQNKKKSNTAINSDSNDLEVQCSFCFKSFFSRSQLCRHTTKCKEFIHKPILSSPPKINSVARKKTNTFPNLKCIRCNYNFTSFQTHHNHIRTHIGDFHLRISLVRLESSKEIASSSGQSDGSSFWAVAPTASVAKLTEENGLKLKIVNKNKVKRGRPSKVHILNSIDKVIQDSTTNCKDSGFYEQNISVDDNLVTNELTPTSSSTSLLTGSKSSHSDSPLSIPKFHSAPPNNFPGFESQSFSPSTLTPSDLQSTSPNTSLNSESYLDSSNALPPLQSHLTSSISLPFSEPHSTANIVHSSESQSVSSVFSSSGSHSAPKNTLSALEFHLNKDSGFKMNQTHAVDRPTEGSNLELSNMPSQRTGPLESFDNSSASLNFLNRNACSERPPSVYQPQFESFTGDWFNEYDSGSRIAAAITGSNSGPQSTGAPHGNSNGSTSFASGNPNLPVSKDAPVSTPGAPSGLFSQAVLGAESTSTTGRVEESRQGSFEQLCLNDSFNQNQENADVGEQGLCNQNYNPPYSEQPPERSSDLLSELAYLNNNGQQMNSNRNSLERDQGYGSNSGTPNSGGRPTPSPTDTSFRALATSPLASPTSPRNTSGPTPPLQPCANLTQESTPLAHMNQLSQSPQPCQTNFQTPSQTQPSNGTTPTPPRLTIANNLMPTTSENMLPNHNTNFSQPWSTNVSQPQPFANGFLNNPQMPGALGAPLGNPMRSSMHAPMPMSYRPSPPPRIRGRPPLISHSGRPMMRGPGRPPVGSGISPILPNAGGRGNMSQLQRLPQYPMSNRGQKRGQTAMNSPSKALRREDINVPARQKDNECQIIAVQNRTDGIGVISNIQGGNSTSSRADKSSLSNKSSNSTTDSTIHLSDSITLSVRPNSNGNRDSGREKTGEAGVVANLLASRGITVSSAAGEKEGASADPSRRLPTASDLNLSSAISVHPPTSRDRDGFAVPHPPSKNNSGSSSSVNNEVDRPPRPPTVDLTQEVSSNGSQATRLQCSQCNRTFPTQSLLADHSKVHQQQAQTRMPYKCHLCTAGFSTQKGQQNHYQQFHQLHFSAGDLGIPVIDLRNAGNVQRMARLGIRSFLPLNNLQNRGAGGVVGIPILSLENLQNGLMNLQQWGISDVLTLGPPRTVNMPSR